MDYIDSESVATSFTFKNSHAKFLDALTDDLSQVHDLVIKLNDYVSTVSQYDVTALERTLALEQLSLLSRCEAIIQERLLEGRSMQFNIRPK